VNEIFISYRRSDSEGQSGRLCTSLNDRFGKNSTVLDVNALEKGRDYRKSIEKHLGTCKALLAVIGPSWLEVKDQLGARRIDNAGDLVRIEIESALKRDIPVIPVLVGNASMPRENDLHGDLKELAFRDGVELTHARWESDVDALAQALEAYVPRPSDPSLVAEAPKFHRAAKVWITAVIVLAVSTWLGYGWYRDHQKLVADELAAAQAASAAAAKAESDRLAAEKAAEEKAAAEKEAAEKAAAAKAAAEKEAAEKVALQRAADKAAAEKAAAEKVTNERAAAQRAAAEKAEADRRAAAEQARATVRDAISSLSISSYGPGGATFALAYSAQDRSPLRTAVRVCIQRTSGGQVPGTSCTSLPLSSVGEGRASVELHFLDATALTLKRNGQAIVEACLTSFPANDVKRQTALRDTCRTLPW